MIGPRKGKHTKGHGTGARPTPTRVQCYVCGAAASPHRTGTPTQHRRAVRLLESTGWVYDCDFGWRCPAPARKEA